MGPQRSRTKFRATSCAVSGNHLTPVSSLMSLPHPMGPYRVLSRSKVLPTCLPRPRCGARAEFRVQSEDVSMTGKCSSDGHAISRNGIQQ